MGNRSLSRCVVPDVLKYWETHFDITVYRRSINYCDGKVKIIAMPKGQMAQDLASNSGTTAGLLLACLTFYPCVPENTEGACWADRSYRFFKQADGAYCFEATDPFKD